MWKHELIEAAEWTRTVFTKIKIENDLGHYCKALESVLKEAPVFYFGDRDNSLLPAANSQKGMMMTFPLNLPYPATVFEYSFKNSRTTTENGWLQHPSTKRAVIAMSKDDKQMFFNFNYMDERKEWAICPIFMRAEKEGSWLGYHYSMIKPNVHPAFTDESLLREGKELDDEMGALATMLSILNCQNVVTKDVLPPEKLNRKRIKNGKLPLYSYKILEVVKGKPKSKDAGSVPWDYKSPEAVRFHLCRGHFKTFTEERPLFGKYSGTFWWNPQSRGDRSKGVVEKEYKVTTAKGA